MAKARSLSKPSRKAGGKPGKAGRPTEPKHPVAKREAAPAGKAATMRQPVLAAPARRKAVVSPARVAERKVELPETPPPLPAPIASFTF
ncbi:MAG TPA: hypothetical protein VKZ18_22105 [Polyangia bacterium]|nr:hypothetical protein [Polyangia bacterium]